MLPYDASLLVMHVGMQAPEFWHPRSACLDSGKDGFDCQRSQTGYVQWWPAMIFLTRLTGQTREHSAMLRRGRNPADAESCSHDSQSWYTLADRDMQGSRVASHQEIGPGQQRRQRIETPGRDERGARACRSSDGLDLGCLPWAPQQQYTSA